MENQIMFKIKNKIRGASSLFFGFLTFSFIVLGVQCSSGKGGDTGGSVATPPPAPVATSCQNGQGVAGACESCNTGFNLSAGACNPIPGAPCQNGQGVAGACVSCDTGFAISAGSCLVQVTVSFDLNGGTGTSIVARTITAGQTITVPSLEGATRAGFVFLGWSTLRSDVGANFLRANDTYTIPSDARTDASRITLYATWGVAYTLTYNLNGGGGTSVDDSMSYPAGTTTIIQSIRATTTRPVNASTSPTDGFFGWGVDANGTGITYTANQTQSFASNTTLYALWYYPISYDCNGGVASGTLPSLTQERTGANLSDLPSTGCNREGYNFVGWSISGNNPRINNMPNSPIALKAIWVYRIMYNLNGGGGTTVEDSMSYSVGATAIVQSIRATTTRPANASTSPTDGFFGWGVDANGTGITYTANQTQSFASNTTLYALWYYPISYDCNGGGASGILPSLTKERTGANLSPLPSTGCNREGFILSGWSLTGNLSSITTIPMPNNPITLKAVWTYQITYNLNGGGGATVEDSMLYSTSTTATIQSIRATTNRPANASTSPTDGFFGWGVNANGTGATYTANQTQGFTSNTTLYALWYYPISYDCNGGVASGVLPNLTKERTGANLSTLVTTGCTRDDHDLVGWSISGNNPRINNMPNNPIALKAIWRQHPLVDSDHDGLIEISTPEQLNHIRYNLEGTSYRTVAGATRGTPAGCPNRICRGYELSANIDLGSTRWGSAYVGANKVAEGWEPIGNCGADEDCAETSDNTPFVATFYGNGFIIQNLYINRPSINGVGFFASISSASLHQVALDKVWILGNAGVGGLVGYQENSNITNSYVGQKAASGTSQSRQGASGTHSPTPSTDPIIVPKNYISGSSKVGGITGWQVNGDISNCYSTSTIEGKIEFGSDYSDEMGGLVGHIEGGKIASSYVSGSVLGNTNTGGLVGKQVNATITDSYTLGDVRADGGNAGGLVGSQQEASSIINSYATGAISGSGSIGGLVGTQESSASSIINCYTSGNVSGSGDNVGGLVGLKSDGSILNSYATGAISGAYHTGGLVGRQDIGSIENSYATGTIQGGGDSIGGLIGGVYGGTISNSYSTALVMGSESNSIGGFIGAQSAGTISNSYSTGNVSGNENVGGFIGMQNTGTITNSYATGSVSGGASSSGNRGGFMGYQEDGATLTGNYWDTTSTGQSTGIGNVASPSMTDLLGLTTAAMKATTGTHPSSLGSCFKLTTGKYPKLYTLVDSLCEANTLLPGQD